MSKTYSAGIVTAYGAAKRAGYQGTYEDFCRQQAGYAGNAAAVEAAKTAAQTAANTATAKAGEATTAAIAAQTAKTQTEQAASQALTDISTARSGTISAVQTEGATQTANATAQAQAAATSATTASTKASEASASATTATTKATEAAASATSAAQSANDAQDVLDSIPADYSDLSANVSQLQADLDTIESSLDISGSLTWSAGYITTEKGGIHAQVNNKYQYYSSLINASDFLTLVVKPSPTRQIKIAKYNKDTGAWVETDLWTSDAVTLDNTYSIRVSIALLNASETEVTKEEQVANVSIFEKASYDMSFIPVVESVYVQDGGASAAAISDLHYVKATSIDLKTGDTITAKTGFEFVVYTSGNSLISGGWKTSYTLASNYTAAIIVVRRTGKNGLIHKETDGLTLYSYIVGNYTSVGNRAFIINDSAVNDLVSRMPVKNRWKGKKAAFLGDSITYGTHTTKAYHAILNDMLGFSDIYVDGVAGSGFCTAGSDGHTPIVDRTANIPTDCELIVIFAGTNDFGHNAPLGTISDSTDVSFYGAIVKTITDVVTAMPTARLVFMTPLHRSGTTYMSEDDVNTEGLVLSDYVTALKKVAELYSIPIIDLWSISGLTPRIPAIKTGYMSDGLHPDTAGHVLLADRISAQLETM